MRLIIAAVGLGALAMLAAPPTLAQPRPKSPTDQGQTARKGPHRVVIQVTQNDPALMNTALNNAENLVRYYESKGEKIEIEFVAYGPGLNMVRSDTSPVKDRLTAIAGNMKNVSFSGCENTRAGQSRAENKAISLVSEAKIVPTGIGRVVELEEQGWTYVRP
jgi:intracellular sulfur oxidation DsrE/DsrF family protein